MRNYAVFILTHGRPHKQKTLKLLRKLNYTGKIYLICDDEDETLNEYKRLYGNMVLVFSKKDYYDTTDTMDNGGNNNVVVYARNASFDLAEKLGLEYFVELDDDYNDIYYVRAKKGYLKRFDFTSLDKLFEMTFDVLDKTGALTIAYAQTGDLIGGADGDITRRVIKRKAMNWFFFKTSRRYIFSGRLNEDVNAYVKYGMIGELVFTPFFIVLNQTTTQHQSGGLTEAYLDMGTYVKSFYTVMLYPGAIKVKTMGVSHPRIHHKVLWEHCTPKIISERYRKQ